jgi:hypothetical protein
MKTATHSRETELPPDAIMVVLKDLSLLPRWAPAFAESVEDAGHGRYRVRKGDTDFLIEFVVHEQSRTVDYLREMAPGRKAGGYLRVIPLPTGGSVIIMTVPVPPGETTENVVSFLDQELEALIKLSSSKI